jgi:ubiquinone/menaquinone biosynthesis C-methylase UbiE
MLDQLQTRYTPLAPYSYTDEALDQRGAQRAGHLVNLAAPGGKTLEVGSSDGMVSYHLAATGLNTAALDLSPALFDDRAEAAGVEFIQGDAAALPIDDRRFDLVFSYNSFEHLHDPAQALSEMIRVVRPGGTIHLDFGALYLSAYGLHAYRSVLVPFCHLLFEREALQD